MTTTDTDPKLCHQCQRRPAATDAAEHVGNIRLQQLSRDENPAVAHVASAAIAHARDAVEWEQLARDPEYADRVSAFRKHAVVCRETSRQLEIVAQDAKAVSTP